MSLSNSRSKQTVLLVDLEGRADMDDLAVARASMDSQIYVSLRSIAKKDLYRLFTRIRMKQLKELVKELGLY
jgi:hypothetical protein